MVSASSDRQCSFDSDPSLAGFHCTTALQPLAVRSWQRPTLGSVFISLPIWVTLMFLAVLHHGLPLQFLLH